MQELIVRSEDAADAQAIDVVNLSAFPGDEEARLVGELRQLPRFTSDLSLVAEFNGRIVGHLMLSPVTLQRPGGEEISILALAPMSVVPSQSHRGIGSELVQTAVDRAISLGYPAIIVVGHPAYYARFGFQSASRWDVRCDLPVPEDAVLAMELTEGALEGGGTVHYPPPFSRVY